MAVKRPEFLKVCQVVKTNVISFLKFKVQVADSN